MSARCPAVRPENAPIVAPALVAIAALITDGASAAFRRSTSGGRKWQPSHPWLDHRASPLATLCAPASCERAIAAIASSAASSRFGHDKSTPAGLALAILFAVLPGRIFVRGRGTPFAPRGWAR